MQMIETTRKLSTFEAGRYWTLLKINEYKCMSIEWDFANNINNPRPWKLSQKLKSKIISFPSRLRPWTIVTEKDIKQKQEFKYHLCWNRMMKAKLFL